MEVITEWTRAASDKHQLCLLADHELVILDVQIKDIASKLLEPMPWERSYDKGTTIPKSFDFEKRLRAVRERVAGVVCYIRLHLPRRLADVPTPGENGMSWLADFRQAYQAVTLRLQVLKQNAILRAIMFLDLLRQDLVTFAPVVWAHYEKSILDGRERMRQELMDSTSGDDDDDGEELWATLWVPRLRSLCAQYPSLTPYTTEKIVHASPRVPDVVLRVGEASRQALRFWDLGHAVSAPATHRVLKALAYDMEPLARHNVYDLRARFDTDTIQ